MSTPFGRWLVYNAGAETRIEAGTRARRHEGETMATVEEGRHPSGWRTLTLRNEQMEVVVLPEKGSEIFALRSRRHDLDVLWKAPWGLRPPPVAAAAAVDAAAWLDHYGGGWQELFPNGGDACVYAGAPHTFHGEASVVPWTYEIDR